MADPNPSPSMLAVDAAGIPKVLPISRALWLKLASQGRVPRGFKLGRRRLWDIDELAGTFSLEVAVGWSVDHLAVLVKPRSVYLVGCHPSSPTPHENRSNKCDKNHPWVQNRLAFRDPIMENRFRFGLGFAPHELRLFPCVRLRLRVRGGASSGFGRAEDMESGPGSATDARPKEDYQIKIVSTG